MKLAKAWRVLRGGVDEFLEESPFEKAAAVSYYALLALAPLLLSVLSIAGLVFDHEAARSRVVAELRGLVGEKGGEVIAIILEQADAPERTTIALVVGLVTLLIGASGVFIELQAALNEIWDAPHRPKGNALWGFLRHRLISMAMVLGLGFLMLVSLLISSGLSAIDDRYSSLVASQLAWQALNAVASFLVISILLTTIFKFLPDVRIAWRDACLGGVATAALFVAGKGAIGAYLGRGGIGSSYGAAGSVVALVVWVYYTSLIFFVGAQITHFYARSKGRMNARAAERGRRDPALGARRRSGDPREGGEGGSRST